MNISQQLVAAGFDNVAQSLPLRMERMRSNGIECDEVALLTTIERDEFRSVKCRMRLAKVATYAELEEHGRLVNLLANYTTESRTWLMKLPLVRLQIMMDAVEASW
ncbi:hypothetical protein [Pseudomonas sp. TSRC2-2]|uniref:hypothetical protein n=1 Tax=Pseudomonas sp. TSRC2-2 TaxID=2804571 RepID=UPI003CF67E4A